MKVTVKDLFESFTALQALSSVVFDSESLNWKIGRIYDAAESEYKRINRHHAKLIRKYGREILIDGKPTGSWIVDNGTEGEEEFQKEWSEFGEEEMTLVGDNYNRILYADLSRAMPFREGSQNERKPLPLTPSNLGVLARWLLINQAAKD